MHASVTSSPQRCRTISNQRTTAERSIETKHKSDRNFIRHDPIIPRFDDEKLQRVKFLFCHEADNQPRVRATKIERTQKVATKIDAFRALVVFTGRWWLSLSKRRIRALLLASD